MKKLWLALLIACLAVIPGLQAGTYTLEKQIVHLQGDTTFGKTLWLESQVRIQFNHLKVGWDHSGKVDRIRYDIACLDGQAVLQNVKYVDGDQVRWEQSAENLNRDFSYVKDNRDSRRDNIVKYSTKLNIAPANPKYAEIQFHIKASGRHYIVVWKPAAKALATTWERL